MGSTNEIEVNNEETELTKERYTDTKPKHVEQESTKKTFSTKAFVGISIVICILAFVVGFFTTVFILNNESYSEDITIYAIENIKQESDNSYLVDYYSVSQNEDDKDIFSETFEINEFLNPESDSIGTSYFREIKRSDNSFLNYLFHYDDAVTVEYKFYITSLDKLKLEENELQTFST